MPGELHPARDVPGRRGRRVEPGDRACHEDGAAVGCLDADRVAVVVGGGHVAVGGVVERHVVGDRRLARDAAQRQRVGAVGVDLELDHVVAQAEQRDRVVAGLHVPVDARVEHQDAVVVVAGPELLRGADHPVGHVAVGLAGRDLEAARQRRTRQRDDDEVAGPEVVCAADDARARRCSGPQSTWHQLMVLPFFCGSASTDSTRPTTIGPRRSEPGDCSDSSLSPSAVSRWASSTAETSSGRSTYSRIHERGARMCSDLRSEGVR